MRLCSCVFFFQAEDGIRVLVRSRGLGDVYKRQELRVVLKHNPLPFHPQAMDAAKLTLEARAQQGEAGFWKAYDALFHEAAIQEDTIDQVAQALRLNAQAVRSALTGNRHQAAIDADMQLAKQLGALGTPTFFINGRKLVGSQPIDVFRTLIDEVSASARVLTTRGVPRARSSDGTVKNGGTQPTAPSASAWSPQHHPPEPP